MWMCVYNIHRTGISDPEEFKPERWEKGSPDYNRYAAILCTYCMYTLPVYAKLIIVIHVSCRLQEVFIPFSLGRRNCIGMNLAMLETKLAAATILRYDITTYLPYYIYYYIHFIYILYSCMTSLHIYFTIYFYYAIYIIYTINIIFYVQNVYYTQVVHL